MYQVAHIVVIGEVDEQFVRDLAGPAAGGGVNGTPFTPAMRTCLRVAPGDGAGGVEREIWLSFIPDTQLFRTVTREFVERFSSVICLAASAQDLAFGSTSVTWGPTFARTLAGPRLGGKVAVLTCPDGVWAQAVIDAETWLKPQGFLCYAMERGVARGIDGLPASFRQDLLAGVDWGEIPSVDPPASFGRVKEFLLAQRERLPIETEGKLYRALLQQGGAASPQVCSPEDFSLCVRLLCDAGLFRARPFGGKVLLQPERLEAYTVALLEAVFPTREALLDGGEIQERRSLGGEFFIDPSVRVGAREQHDELLVAMEEDLFMAHLVYRRVGGDGQVYLSFPALPA